MATKSTSKKTKLRIFDFMKPRRALGMISLIVVLLSYVSLGINGLHFGLDFTGGALIEIGYQQDANLDNVRDTLEKAGYEDVVVQTFGSASDVLIRMGKTDDPKLGNSVLSKLQASEPDQQLELRRNEYVGSQVGSELREKGGLGMLVALAMIMLYLAFRFQFKFSIGAVVALVHDVSITLGVFSITGMEFDLTVLAGVLAVIGYSLNDTIVVYDRIRENFRIMRKATPTEIMNVSLSETLSRTIMTSLTTLLVLVALAVFGGETVFGFAMSLIIGIAVGTYSSIYVAANLLLILNVRKEDLIPPPKERTEIDEMP